MDELSRQPRRAPVSHNPDRQRLLLRATIVILIVIAVLVLILPLRIPRPLRLAVACTDLIAAAVIWGLMRQRFGR